MRIAHRTAFDLDAVQAVISLGSARLDRLVRCPGLISGSVIYRPDPVEPPADGNVLICCSLTHGDVALDL